MSDHARTVDTQRRMDEIEKVYLEMPDPNGARIWAHFSMGTTKEGCTCGRGKGCTDGPPRMVGHDGQPISLRRIQELLKIVKDRLRQRADMSREDNRAMAIARFDVAVQMAIQNGDARDLNIATARRAELDGSHLAAEEAIKPKIYSRVRALMVSVEDYEPPPDLVPADRLPIGACRFQLERLERLLLMADESAARYRALGEPPKDEAQRRQWLARLNAEGAYQRATMPGVPPQKRFEDVNRAATTGGLVSDNVRLGEQATEIEKLLNKGG